MKKNSRILITGAHGFLGQNVVKEFRKQGYSRLILPTHRQYDLSKQSRIESLFKKERPEAVIHLAARVGGIGANRLHPGEYFYHNLVMGAHLIEASRIHGVKKFTALGTICSYPKFTPVPFKESDLWIGYPEETNAPYGLAKKMMLVQSQSYRDQYGFNSIFLLPVNLYGPGDNFDPASSHVIPAMIRKFSEAMKGGERQITLWGDGSPSREFLYVEDCARAIRLATERYNESDPVNIGTGSEINIKKLAILIKDLMGFKGKIVWDKSQPNGQPRRCLDTKLAAKHFGFRSKVTLETGLKKTIKWYKENVA